MSRQAWFWSSLTLFGLVVAVGWLLAPDEVPLHFGASGEATRSGSATSLATTFVVVGAATAVIVGGLARWMPRLPAVMINLPQRHHAWWTSDPDRLARLRRMLAGDLWVFGAVTIVFLSVVAAAAFAAAHDEPQVLGWEMPVALVAYLGFVGVWSWYLLRGRYAVPEDEA